MFYRAFREVLLNLYRTPTLGTEASGHFRKVVVVERLKQEWMYGLSAKKKAVVESSRWPLVEVRLQEMDSKVCMNTQVRYLLPRP